MFVLTQSSRTLQLPINLLLNRSIPVTQTRKQRPKSFPLRTLLTTSRPKKIQNLASDPFVSILRWRGMLQVNAVGRVIAQARH